MLIFVGEIGSGKIMQILQFVLEVVNEKNFSKWLVGCIQFCRVVVMFVVSCVVEEMDVVIGEEVGYFVCFEDCISFKIVFKYLIDGMFMREVMIDLFLQRYKVIVFDEVYERILVMDLLFGVLK